MLALKLFFLALIGAPFAFVSLGVLLWHGERRALHAAVRSLGCPSCGAELSELAVQTADELWQRHVKIVMDANRWLILRIVRRLDAVCGACGVRLVFDQKSRVLRPTTVVLAFETDGGTDMDVQGVDRCGGRE